MVWHNRGNVCRLGWWKGIGSGKGRHEKSLADNSAFVTFAPGQYEAVYSTQESEWKREGENKQARDRRGNWGQLMLLLTHREEGPRCNYVATVRWLAKQKYQETIVLISKNLAPLVDKEDSQSYLKRLTTL